MLNQTELKTKNILEFGDITGLINKTISSLEWDKLQFSFNNEQSLHDDQMENV